jgi:hypothetical protein
MARKETDAAEIHQCPGDAVRCKAVRSGARLIWDKNRRQPTRGEHDTRAPVHRRLCALPWRSWTFSRSATMSTAKRRGAVAPALPAAPSLLTSLDSQIVRRQRVSPATAAWDILTADFAAIEIGEVDDRRTISREQAPATNSKSITYKTRPATIVADRALFAPTVAPSCLIV